MEFFKVWSKHHFSYIWPIYQCIFSLDIFISFSKASVLITWIGLFYTLWGHHFKSTFFSTHLDAPVQAVAVKAVTPGGDYQLVKGWLPVSEVWDTGDTSETRNVKF